MTYILYSRYYEDMQHMKSFIIIKYKMLLRRYNRRSRDYLIKYAQYTRLFNGTV